MVDVSDEVIRSSMRQDLKNIFMQDDRFKKFTFEKLDDIVTEIERGCNNFAILTAGRQHVTPINWCNTDFCRIYSAIMFKIKQNLDPTSPVKSKYLINKIHKSKINPYNLAEMDSHDLCPTKSDGIIKERKDRLNMKIEHKTTNRFSCPNCGAKEAQSKNVQLRSLDEGYNLSLTCINCNYKWVH